MTKYNETDFLSEITESCNSIVGCWNDMRILDFGEIQRIKSKMESLLLSEKSTILQFYEYGKTKGMYQFIYCKNLLQVLCDYESYHDDLLGFIKTMISNETKVHGQINVLEYVTRACEADKNFRETELYKNAESRILFKEALDNLDAATAFCLFLDKVKDCFIELSEQEVAIPRVKALLEMYQFSVTEFIREFATQLTLAIKVMKEATSGKMPEKGKSSEYVLI